MEVIELLKKMNIDYQMCEHEAIFTVKESEKVKIDLKGIGVKSLFLRDNEKKFYMYILEGYKKADFKMLKQITNKKLEFASEEELYEKLKLKPGSVSPFGIINDTGSVIIIIDKDLENKTILIHPNRNTATVAINVNDLYKIINKYGNKIIKMQ